MSLDLCWMPPEDIGVDPTPPFRSLEGARSRDALLAAVEQYRVDEAPRYRARYIDDRGHKVYITTCNIFTRDCALAMGCPWPRMTANQLYDWMPSKSGGLRYGWTPVRPAEAFGLVESGFMVVPVYQSPTGHGHVAVCVPQPAVPGKVVGLRTAQAGAVNFVSKPITASFGGLPFRLFAHQ